MNNNESTPTFALNGLRMRFNVNNVPPDLDLNLQKERTKKNTISFSFQVKQKSPSTEQIETENENEIIPLNKSEEVSKEELVVKDGDKIETSKSRVSFKANTYLPWLKKSYSESSISESISGSNLSEVSGFTNIFKKDSATLIPLTDITGSSSNKTMLSNTNVSAVESVKCSEADFESSGKNDADYANSKNKQKSISTGGEPVEKTAASYIIRCENELKYMRIKLVEALQNMESMQRKLESLSKKQQL